MQLNVLNDLAEAMKALDGEKDSGVSSTSSEALAFSKGVVGHCL